MSKEKELRSNKMSAPGSSRLSSPPSFSKDDSHTILHRMPRNGNPRDLFSCLFGALPFSPAAISLYLPVYSCQARPLLIIYGIIIPDDCQCLCFLPVKSVNSFLWKLQKFHPHTSRFPPDTHARSRPDRSPHLLPQGNSGILRLR